MSLAHELIHNCDQIVQRWYDTWQRSPHARPELSEAALKDLLPAQLHLIGQQLADLTEAEHPKQMWKVTDRLEPELRVRDEMPIEEVVLEYGVVVSTVREWLKERQVQVSFDEYSYFFQAVHELTAESVRRYATHQADLVAQERSEYLAGVMHQLRTPVSALTMQVELLARPGAKLDAAAVGKLRRNARRLEVLVNGVLRLERFRPEDQPLRPQELAPAQLIDELLGDYEYEAARKGLRLEAHVDRALHMRVDPDLLADVLGNLVHNAVKYTPAGHVSVQAEERRDQVVFRVHDSGPGIPLDTAQTLFKDVQPGSATGIGIGLLVAARATQAMQGEIGVDSEPGKGSTFWVRLPRALAPREAAGATS